MYVVRGTTNVRSLPNEPIYHNKTDMVECSDNIINMVECTHNIIDMV